MKFEVSGQEYEAGPELQAAIDALQASRVETQKQIDEAVIGRAKADARFDMTARLPSKEEIDRRVADEADFRWKVMPFLPKGFDFAGKSREDVQALAERNKRERSESYVPSRTLH